jgi:hypothetical protein
LINKFYKSKWKAGTFVLNSFTSSLPLVPFNRHSNSRLNQLGNTRTTKKAEGRGKIAKEKENQVCFFVSIDTWARG